MKEVFDDVLCVDVGVGGVLLDELATGLYVVAWNLWSSNHFHFYLSGTVLLEKCISFKYRWQESQTVNSVRPWQFSIRAAFGAEYAFTPQFGIYFEPSLGYYFNDGSSLRHYYKERPFAPSLDFGLRLHLK